MCEQRRGVRIVHTNSEVTLECKLSLWSTGGIKGTETIKSTRKILTNLRVQEYRTGLYSDKSNGDTSINL